jgi:hypothetical protein
MRALWAALGLTVGVGLFAFFLADRGRQQRLRHKLDHLSDTADAALDRARASIRQAVRAVSLNTVSREELLEVYGIGPVLADRIISNRPYQNDYDVVEKGIIPESGYRRLQSELHNRRVG